MPPADHWPYVSLKLVRQCTDEAEELSTEQKRTVAVVEMQRLSEDAIAYAKTLLREFMIVVHKCRNCAVL